MGKHILCKQFKKKEVATLIWDKVDFKAKKIIRDKEEHYLMIKESIHQKDMVILNVHIPKNSVSKYMKTNRQTNKKLTGLKGEKDKSPVIAGNSTSYS